MSTFKQREQMEGLARLRHVKWDTVGHEKPVSLTLVCAKVFGQKSSNFAKFRNFCFEIY